jgi:hypothetical protein
MTTLLDYANARENVVLFFAGVGFPTGAYTLIGHPDFDFADRRGLLELEGEIDADGDWRWNGNGNPTDDSANSLTKLHAYVSAKAYAEIVEEYETGF